MNPTAVSQHQGQKSGPAMETANELRRRGLATGEGEQIAWLIDQLTALPYLLDILMDLHNGARMESDARAFQRYVLDQTSAALDRAGFKFSYFDDGMARLAAMRDLLRRPQ